MIETDMLILFVATIAGALTASILGWLDSQTPFEPRKFIPSAIRGVIAAIIVFVASYSGFVGEMTLFTVLGAYLAGGGFDALGNRLSGIIQAKT